MTHVHVCVHLHACGIAEELAFIPNRSIHTIKINAGPRELLHGLSVFITTKI